MRLIFLSTMNYERLDALVVFAVLWVLTPFSLVCLKEMVIRDLCQDVRSVLSLCIRNDGSEDIWKEIVMAQSL